jgi:glycosyltransferase involved in cell wall biosynthesis
MDLMNNIRLGIIARSDNTGLGNQTKELVDMLNPSKVLLIDSTKFNKNKQFPERYKDYDVTVSNGFIDNALAKNFLSQVDVVLSCEIFYNRNFVTLAKRHNVKTVLQYNYEFLDYLRSPEDVLPDVFLAPSTWNLQHVEEMFGNKTKVLLLPPPTSPDDFLEARSFNLDKKHNRILHVAGKAAMKDRNGTDTVLEMLKYSNSNYELVITSQTEMPKIKDSRVTVEYGNKLNKQDLYSGFDAMVLPRRYGGLCLPMNEALMSGLPVFMSNVSPNEYILPSKWLAPVTHAGKFMTRTEIDYFTTNPEELASIVDKYMNNNVLDGKNEAIAISEKFNPVNLKSQYLDVLFN